MPGKEAGKKAAMTWQERPIKIAFSASRGLGTLIRIFTGGDVNHAFLIFYDPIFDAELTLGANANGLTIEHLNNFTDPIIHVFETVDQNKGLELGLRLWAHLLNKPYDFAGLVGMAAVEIARRAADLKINNPLQAEQRLFCSEFVRKVLTSSRYEVLPDLEAGECDPAQLCQALMDRPEQFREVRL